MQQSPEDAVFRRPSYVVTVRIGGAANLTRGTDTAVCAGTWPLAARLGVNGTGGGRGGGGGARGVQAMDDV